MVIERGNPEPIHFDIYTGPDCMERFLSKIEKLAKFFYHQKRKYPIFIGKPPSKIFQTCCWICDVPFETDDEKVLDHCHFRGQFLGYAHNECNLKRRTLDYTPVIAHNMMNYDLHHIVKTLHSATANVKIEVIPTNDEKFIALNYGVYIETRRRKRDEVAIYEYLRFIDSFKFMPRSLIKLVQTLPHDKFTILDNFYHGYSHEQRELLKHKGNFSYSYVDSFDKLNDLELPGIRHWKNSLKDNSIDITYAELDQLKKVFREFNCENLKQFLELYLTGDVLQLACWFEELRSVCYKTYSLDCAQFYTASNLSGSACLKVCQPQLELLTDRELLDMTERMIRGGVAPVFSSRLERANSPSLPNYDQSKELASIIYIDANNLYGGVMFNYPLPEKAFELVTKITLEEILRTDDNGEIGFVVEVDLEYPDAIHEKHSDFPIICDKQPIDPLELKDELLKITSEGVISTIKVIDANLSLITKKKQNIMWNNPTIVGACILELSKLFMMDFHYNVMKKETSCHLLYSDTDSFIYKVQTGNFYDDLSKNPNLIAHFDLSNLPKNHPLYDQSNEKVVLKFKDELAGAPIEEFCALKPKLYSLIAGGFEKMSAKGTKKFAQSKLHHELFKKTLETGELVGLENVKIASTKHQLETVCVNKIALSAYDDKRNIKADRKTTLPFGHFSFRDEYISMKICDEPDWGIESEEDINVFNLPEGGEASGWGTPDPGFNQRTYSKEELEDVVDLTNLSEMSDESDHETPHNPFILTEAEESERADTSPSTSDDYTPLSVIK
ncbi:uncharacterized protein LOC142336624 [Convolutriloba macropyga]|uniref:uncharacterized protein LOC142336624 n=1 Tax=Convolutriloba macropyga TaxID=536237 RepID=UPI003F526B6C